MKTIIVVTAGLLLGTTAFAQNQSTMKTTNQKNVNVQKKDDNTGQAGDSSRKKTKQKKAKQKTTQDSTMQDTMSKTGQ